MKKGALALLGLSCCLPVAALDWNLPVVSLRYEIAGGSTEDAEDDTLEPSSLRNTVSLRVREDADPATFGLDVTMSDKDYYQQSGDYSYVKVQHDASFRVSDPLKLGYSLGMKRIVHPGPDSPDLSRDALCVNGGATAAVRLLPGTTVDGGWGAVIALTDNPADAAQAWSASIGLTARIGSWVVGARCRGQLRLPLGGASDYARSFYSVASVSFQWDPN